MTSETAPEQKLIDEANQAAAPTEPAVEEKAPVEDHITPLKEMLNQQGQAMQQLHAELQNQKAFTTGLLAQLQAGSPEQEVEPEVRAEQNRERLVKDPERFIEEQFQARTAPILNDQLRTLVDLNKQIAIAKLGDTWKKYEPKVEAFLSQMDPRYLTKPGAFETALKMVRLEHFDDEVEEAVKKRLERQTVAFSEPATNGGTPEKATPTINDVEKRIAEGMKMTPEDYIKWRDA